MQLHWICDNCLFHFRDIKMCMYTSMFSIIFTKGNNFCDFLFASLVDIDTAFPNWGFILKG